VEGCSHALCCLSAVGPEEPRVPHEQRVMDSTPTLAAT